MGIKGRVFNIQRFSLQDGPGLRSTAFLKGCPLACAWCHNPESQAPEIALLRMEKRCMGCGHCSPEEVAKGDCSRRTEADVEFCPTGALQFVGRDWEVDDLVKTLLRDRLFFEESHGGVTFSGGEPLMQAPFVIEALGRLRAEGVHTALDTCGFAKWEDLRDASALANLVLYDVKLMDEERHRAVTGESSRTILENLAALAEIHPAIWIRVPIIPGINDDAENLEATADFLAPLPGIRRVDLLPYHATGEAKFARVGMKYALHDVASPSPEHMSTLAAIFRARGLKTTIGGRS